MGLFSISLLTNEAETLVVLLAIHLPVFVEYLILSFAHFGELCCLFSFSFFKEFTIYSRHNNVSYVSSQL